MVALLRPHKAAQAAERLRAGDQWAGTNNLVFMTELGRPVDPRNLRWVVEAAAKTTSVEGVAVHTLRHSAAVGWLEAGVHDAAADLIEARSRYKTPVIDRITRRPRVARVLMRLARLADRR